MPLSVPRNMTIPLSLRLRLVLDDDCGVTTRNRPAPRKADEDDTEPILALPTWRVEDEGANAPLGLGNVVNTAKKPRPRPTSSRRLCAIFLFIFRMLSERGTRRSERNAISQMHSTLERGITTRETMAAMPRFTRFNLHVLVLFNQSKAAVFVREVYVWPSIVN